MRFRKFLTKACVVLLAAALTLWVPAPAFAAAGPLFTCTATAPNVCRFRIFYARGDRIVVLPAGMKQNVPGVTVGSDSYCVAVNANPRWGCTRKPVGASNT
jgi:hypothetical protein